jgi:hypothetical protein
MEHEDKRENRGVLFALILLTVGALLLLNNFGFLSWDVWDTLWKFWPIIIIFWGLETILGRSYIHNILVILIGLAIIIFILVYTLYPANFGFGKQQQKMFKCSPFDNSCYQYFNN